MFAHMTQAQKVSIAIGATVIFLMLLFPPFHTQIEGYSLSEGYGFLFAPPKTGKTIPPAVNISMLLTQWLGALIVTTLAFFFFMGREQLDDTSNAVIGNRSPQDAFSPASEINDGTTRQEDLGPRNASPRASQEYKKKDSVPEEMKVESSLNCRKSGREDPEAKTSGLAVASFILGIIGIPLVATIIPWLLAIILGHMARNQILRSNGMIVGNGFYITGLVLGYAVPVLIVSAAILIPMLSGT